MKFPRLDEQDDIQINLTPLIDVVFMLLVFFILTTNFVKENRLSLVLPQAESRYPPQNIPLTVIVDAQGNYVVNGKKISDSHRDTLSLELQRARGDQQAADLRITADARVAHSKVILVMDVAGQLGFTNIRITTREADHF